MKINPLLITEPPHTGQQSLFQRIRCHFCLFMIKNKTANQREENPLGGGGGRARSVVGGPARGVGTLRAGHC